MLVKQRPSALEPLKLISTSRASLTKRTGHNRQVDNDYCENPQIFLLYDNGTDAEERVIIFSTDAQMQCLATSDKWFMDGTFGVAPTLFSQLYVIHGQVSFLPIMFIIWLSVNGRVNCASCLQVFLGAPRCITTFYHH